MSLVRENLGSLLPGKSSDDIETAKNTLLKMFSERGIDDAGFIGDDEIFYSLYEVFQVDKKMRIALCVSEEEAEDIKKVLDNNNISGDNVEIRKITNKVDIDMAPLILKMIPIK